MWTPNLVTFKEEERTTAEIYRLIYIFKKRFIQMTIIVKRKRAAKQASGDAAGKGCAKWASADAAADQGLSGTVNTVTITT